MAECAVFSVIQSIGKLLLSEARFLREKRDDLKTIETTLRNLQATCRDADLKQYENAMIRNWVVQTREAAYDAEDIVDIFAVQNSEEKEESLSRKYFNLWKNFTSLHRLGSAIRGIKETISALEKNPILSQLENSVPQNSVRTYPHGDDIFIGLDEDVQKLVAVVKEESDISSHVVTIIGMAGVGKTALVRKLYNHGDVRSHFTRFAWVCVSRQWNLEDVLQRILNELLPEQPHQIDTTRDKLMKDLVDIQTKEKCLIVLDDVWKNEFWEKIGSAFSSGKQGSRILLTTRNKQVADGVRSKTTCTLYEQRCLSETESWRLFLKKAFPQPEIEDERVHKDMKDLGKKIVGQCRGLPLAIVELGGHLRTKTNLGEWEEVHRNLTSCLWDGRMVDGKGKIYKELDLSYRDLPFAVKPCFLLMGNFPEDFWIPTRKLYQMWAAEGFIPSGEESMMFIGKGYLNELVERCMVQVRADRSTGHFKSCQLRDFMREFCILKGHEENFLRRFPLSHEQKLMGFSVVSSSKTPTGIIRRLAISVDGDSEKHFSPNPGDLEHVRAATFFSTLADRKKLMTILRMLCKCFKLLRVLDLERYHGIELPEAIGDLVHLRYLSLRDSQFYRLPSSIGNLRLLQTLDLRVPSSVCLTIPDVIWMLTNLIHLYLPLSHQCSWKLRLDTLKKLEILKNFNSRVSDFRDIFQLTKLRKLTGFFCLKMKNMIAINEYLMSPSNHLQDCSFRFCFDFLLETELALLQELVGGRHLHRLILVGVIYQLPQLHHFSEGITKLTLIHSCMKEDPMVILEQLPKLYSLMLGENAFMGHEFRCSRGGFRQLRTLIVQGLASLEKWEIEQESMSNLKCFTIDKCINLRAVPDGLISISTIREVVIAHMSEDFINSFQSEEGVSGNVAFKVTIIRGERRLNTHTQGTRVFGSRFFGSFSPETVPKEWRQQTCQRCLDL